MNQQTITQILGGLRSCIDAHGPITSEFITSAAKRIAGNLKNHTYTPSEEATRMAPAFVCGLASRVTRAREKYERLKAEDPTTAAKLEEVLREILSPLPFEKELLSGDIAQVDRALRGEQ